MKRREFIAGFGGTAALPLPAIGSTPAQAISQSATNVIFLMTDQQRWDALGRVNPIVNTPNLDRLAKSGVLFRSATCQSPICTPSRNSMMFGLYPSQLGVRSNFTRSIGDQYLPFEPLPSQLRNAGYQTAGFGKTHWGPMKEVPSTRGFEVRVVGAKEVGLEQGARYQEDSDPEGLARYRSETADYGAGEEEVAGYIGCTSKVAERDHRDGWVAEQCLKFLNDGVDPKRPLFLYLSFLKPHAGLNVPKRFEDLYRIEDIPDTVQPPWANEHATHLAFADRKDSGPLKGRYARWRQAWSKMSLLERRRTTLHYYANCSWLDSYFGQVIEKLEKLGRLQNALIVCVSDHGEMLGERNFRFSKYCLYDSSVRVPMILSGSAVPTSLRGKIDDCSAELVDLFPTIAHVARFQAPAGLPGSDLLSAPVKVRAFSEFHDGGAPAYMWRKTDWKLIMFLNAPFHKILVDSMKSAANSMI